MLSLDSWWWRFLETYIYAERPPPPRRRTTPLQVLCVGPPRSGTESLSQALAILGYDHSYHGWDILFEAPHRMQAWAALARSKWYGRRTGSADLAAADFDAVLGHAAAVADAPASVFAAELVAAYPEAKVVLNTRSDLDEWLASMDKTIVAINDSWMFWLIHFFHREAFWAWHVSQRYLWAPFFRAPDGHMATGIRRNGKWVYQGKQVTETHGFIMASKVANCFPGQKNTATWFEAWCPRKDCSSGRLATAGNRCASFLTSRYPTSRFLMQTHRTRDGRKESSRP